MNKKLFFYLRISFVALTYSAGISGCITDRIVDYPAIPGCVTSDIYKITVNGQSIWTEKFLTQMDIEKLPDWFTSFPYTQIQQEVHIANFSYNEEMTIRIKVPGSIEKAFVRPLSREINTDVQGGLLEFKISGPDKLYIEIDDLPPLCLFANPLETDVPDPEAPNLRYFGPGVHQAGIMELKDNEQIYIAGGAIVYGGIRVNGTSNIRVFGRGILDGNFEHRSMVLLKDGEHIEFNGIMIRNGRGWTNTVINCYDVNYKEVKVISFGPSGDGINPVGSSQMIIDNCFLRCTDDCIAIKSPDSTHVVKDILITNNTMIGFAFSDAVTIGFETNGPAISDVTVKNCDVLIARGGSRVEGHSAFSIICDGPAVIQDILFEDIRAEERMLKLFELHITDGTIYGINPPGHIRNIHLKNISWETSKPIILKGYSNLNQVQNVIFENCTVEGELLTDTREDIFEIGEFVEGIHFK